jgi:hypothetical protein
MSPSRDLSAPLHSVDPADWWMYSDLLQEAGAIPFLAERARRIGDSLARAPNLVLVLYCPERGLENHWLRVARSWFIPVSGTILPQSSAKDLPRWFRPEWVRAGFKRYPHDTRRYGRRGPSRMIRFASGTPWSKTCKADVRAIYGEQVVGWFFYAHSRTELPEAWR